MPSFDRTHDPRARSWIESANNPSASFPIQNLPYGVFTSGDDRHVGVAIGDKILDLTVIEAEGLIAPGGTIRVFQDGVLNPLMALPQNVWSETRAAIFDLLETANKTLAGNATLRERAFVPLASAQLHLPFYVRSFTDFYASKEHATNVGVMFRDPNNALMPNWLHIPIGYNGRASTVVVSGTEIHRPLGQTKGPSEETPKMGPCQKLDIELELGAVVGKATKMGQPVTTAEAYEMIFGYVLLNDWSARDIQFWEYQPLGPFQSKAFATTISPWVVTRQALEPFRVPTPERVKPLLPYLTEATPNNFDINLEVTLAPAGRKPTTISLTNYRHMYYSAAQQLTHHASSGCAMCTGDLLGSGTISGPDPNSFGSLLELTWNGRDALAVDGGERTFIEDGDTLTLTGYCEGPYRVGFGSCTGTILPAPVVEGW